MQRVYDRVPCHFDDRVRDTFTQQVLPCPFCWGEVQVCDHPGDTAIDLFGERLPFIVGAQPRLEVTEMYAAIVGQQGCDGDRGRVALSQHPVGLEIFEHRIKMREDGCA